MATMRTLLDSGLTDKQILNKLLGMHVGVRVGADIWYQEINGSIWTIGSTIPTLDWVKKVRQNVDLIDDLSFFKSWLDEELVQHRNWTKSPAMQSLCIEGFRQGMFF